MSYTPKRQNDIEPNGVFRRQATSLMIQDNRRSTHQNIQLQGLMGKGTAQQQNIQLKQRMAAHQQQTPLQNTTKTPVQAQYSQTAPIQMRTPWAYIPNKVAWSGGQLVQKDNYHVSMVELGDAPGNFSKFHITDEITDEEKNPHFFFKDTGEMEHGNSNQHPQSVAFKEDEELNVEPHTWEQLKEAAPGKATAFLDEVTSTNNWGAETSFTMTGRFPKANDAEAVKSKLPEFEEDTSAIVATKGAKSGNKHFMWKIKLTFADRDKAYASWQALKVTAPWTLAEQG